MLSSGVVVGMTVELGMVEDGGGSGEFLPVFVGLTVDVTVLSKREDVIFPVLATELVALATGLDIVEVGAYVPSQTVTMRHWPAVPVPSGIEVLVVVTALT